MKLGILKCAIGLLVSAVAITTISFSQEKPIEKKEKERIYTNKEDNAKCLSCHGGKYYMQKNPTDTTQSIKKAMYAELIIDTAAYYVANHWNFKCLDCHSAEYLSLPHNKKLAFEPMQTCTDCHAGDPQYASLHFEDIEKDYLKSGHATKMNKDFSCWKCHDAHTYKLNARNRKQDIAKTIAYDNAFCLNCHGADAKKQITVDVHELSIVAQHTWLPNHLTHMKNVRCIECHAEQNDSTMVAHNIMPKAKAVRKCATCHSKNSLLVQSLYKFQLQEQRSKNGFFNSIILNNSYVIGANRNYFLNIASQILFGLTLLGIGFHVTMRIISKNKKH